MGVEFVVFKARGVLVSDELLKDHHQTFSEILEPHNRHRCEPIVQLSQGGYDFSEAFTLFVYDGDLEEILFNQKIGGTPFSFMEGGPYPVKKTSCLRGGAKEPFVVILDFIQEEWKGFRTVEQEDKGLADIMRTGGQHVRCLFSYYD